MCVHPCDSRACVRACVCVGAWTLCVRGMLGGAITADATHGDAPIEKSTGEASGTTWNQCAA